MKKSKQYKKIGRAGWNSRKTAKLLKKERNLAKLTLALAVAEMSDDAFGELFDTLDKNAQKNIINVMRRMMLA